MGKKKQSWLADQDVSNEVWEIRFEKLQRETSALLESKQMFEKKKLFRNIYWIFFLFSTEMNRLWNLCPDNMAACRSKDRDFLPTLENYFEEAIEQLDPSVESQYK